MPSKAAVTVGIDLAAQPVRTVACRLTWADRITVEWFPRATDDELRPLFTRRAVVGIDSPLGWPADFVTLIGRVAKGKSVALPGRHVTADGPTGLDRLTHRVTDNVTWRSVGSRPPLSVSTDRLGVVALRAAALLSTLPAKIDTARDGSGAIAEVYPAAALQRWGIAPRMSYKTPAGTDLRRSMLDKITEQLPALDRAALEPVAVDSHDAFDAFVCALVARAVALGRTDRPGKKHRDVARVEGWIHVPRAGSLAELGATA